MPSLPRYSIPEDLEQVLDQQSHQILKSEKSLVYAQVLKKLKEAKSIDLAENHYLQLLKIALYLEEYQCELDIRNYDLQKKCIVQVQSQLFCIETTDDDEIPMIRPSDFIDIIDTTDKKCYSLRVVRVNEKSIVVRSDLWFSERYSVTKLYNIQFRYQNYPLRCNHYALSLIHRHNVLTYLFPKICQQSLKSTTTNHSPKMNFFDSSIKSNPEQTQAVFNILHKSSFPHPYILYGPPGTGKTATIVESIYQIIKRKPGNRVLVCTPSNTAADELTRRLLDCMKSGLVYRMYSRTKDPLSIDKKILPYCNCQEDEIIPVKREDMAKKRVIVTTLCNSIKLILMKLECYYFSHVIIDEVGQSIEPDILIPISLVSWNGKLYSQIVLAGDPKQLGPTVMSKLAAIVLGRSVLDRLMSYPIYQKMSNGKFNSKYITELLINYRSHPDIIRISNALFYNNELITRPAFQHDLKFPVRFYAVFGAEEKSNQPNSTSSRNRKEVSLVLELINDLIKNKQAWGLDKGFQDDIGVVTPFKLQSKEIKRELINRNLKNINVGTVELFQGQERKIIIISTVRSEVFRQGNYPHIGSLSNPKRFNVAVTRAKSKLIVIGNPDALKVDPYWGYLIKYCIDNQSYYGDFSRSNLLDNATPSRPVDHSEVINSRSLIKWRPFKIFKLDDRDTEKDIKETTRLILNTAMKSESTKRASSPTQAEQIIKSAWSRKLIINPSPPTQSTSVANIKTERLTEQIIVLVPPAELTLIPEKLASPIESTPILNIESGGSTEHIKPSLTAQSTLAVVEIETIIAPSLPPVQSTFISKTDDVAVNSGKSTPIQLADSTVPKKENNSGCTIL